jgi:excisionase family DNA binding protein
LYKQPIMKTYLNAAEVAKLLNVDRATVSRWVKRGLIRNAVRVSSKQQWRIPLSSYKEIVRQQQHESH